MYYLSQTKYTDVTSNENYILNMDKTDIPNSFKKKKKSGFAKVLWFFSDKFGGAVNGIKSSLLFFFHFILL